MRLLTTSLAVLFITVAAAGPAHAVRRARAAPKRILGKAIWRLLHKTAAKDVRLERLKRRDGRLAVAQSATPSKRWWRKMRRLLRSPRSYFVPRCDRNGVCPKLRCRTTPKVAMKLLGWAGVRRKLARGKARGVIVITVCNAVMAGASLNTLGDQVSLEPAEKRLERLLAAAFRKPKARRRSCPPKGWRKQRHCVLVRCRAKTRQGVLASLQRAGYQAVAAQHPQDVEVSLNARELARLFGARYTFGLTALSSRSGMGCIANVKGGGVPKRYRKRIVSYAVGHQICE